MVKKKKRMTRGTEKKVGRREERGRWKERDIETKNTDRRIERWIDRRKSKLTEGKNDRESKFFS